MKPDIRPYTGYKKGRISGTTLALTIGKLIWQSEYFSVDTVSYLQSAPFWLYNVRLNSGLEHYYSLGTQYDGLVTYLIYIYFFKFRIKVGSGSDFFLQLSRIRGKKFGSLSLVESPEFIFFKWRPMKLVCIPGMRIRSEPLIFGLPDPAYNNGYTKLFSSWTKYKPKSTNWSYDDWLTKFFHSGTFLNKSETSYWWTAVTSLDQTFPTYLPTNLIY